MDNLNNNFPNSQPINSTNDDTKPATSNYNSIQPQSDLSSVTTSDVTNSPAMDMSSVNDLSGEPSSFETQNDSVFSSPSLQDTSSLPSDSTSTSTPLDSLSTQSSIGNVPPAKSTPVNGFSPSSQSTQGVPTFGQDTLSTLTESSSSQSPDVQPSIGNVPPAEATPVDGFSPSSQSTQGVPTFGQDTLSTLTESSPSQSPDVQPSIGNVPPAEATPVNGFSPSSPIAKDVSPLTSDAMSTLGSMDNISSETPSTSDTENAFSSSALNADISNSPMNLNQPLPDVTGNTFRDESSTSSQDVVNTLDKTDKSDGDSNVVVIILVVIIVLLLAGIGYFAYQIFLA